MNVGIRELKSHLSQYLARVRDGEEVVVTDRGKPVARIEPVGRDALPAKLRELIKTGRAIDKGPMRHVPPRIRLTPGDKTWTDFVREQRR